MSKQISYSATNFEQIFVVAFRLLASSPQPDVYALVLYNEVERNDGNRPLTNGEQLIFFRSPQEARQALQLGDKAFRKYGKVPAEVAYVYDVPDVLTAVTREEFDATGTIASFLNELFDFVKATPSTMPASFRDTLSALADWTTFDQNIGEFFRSGDHRRDVARDGILWGIGAVSSSARLL